MKYNVEVNASPEGEAYYVVSIPMDRNHVREIARILRAISFRAEEDDLFHPENIEARVGFVSTLTSKVGPEWALPELYRPNEGYLVGPPGMSVCGRCPHTDIRTAVDRAKRALSTAVEWLEREADGLASLSGEWEEED